MTSCILCHRDLVETTTPGILMHDDVEDCLVRVTDDLGVSMDDRYEVRGQEIWTLDEDKRSNIIELPTFKPMEEAMIEIFASAGLDRLGGRSTGSGWSNVSLFQRCRYAWSLNYRHEKQASVLAGEPVPLAVGILVHTYLALHYQLMMVPDYPLTPDIVDTRVRELGCSPEVVGEAWRLFKAYRLYYRLEKIQPLAIEANFVDPRTNQSCRYDMIAYVPEETPGRLPGTYVVEHKTASRFDRSTIEGWLGDGEILGQVDTWERLHLDKRFGPLRGVIINLLGKQKTPEFSRVLAAPSAFAIEQHRRDLRHWNAEIQLANATNTFPRSRANCISRYGFCGFWNHCNLGE